jgi:hypothetical protein
MVSCYEALWQQVAGTGQSADVWHVPYTHFVVKYGMCHTSTSRGDRISARELYKEGMCSVFAAQNVPGGSYKYGTCHTYITKCVR